MNQKSKKLLKRCFWILGSFLFLFIFLFRSTLFPLGTDLFVKLGTKIVLGANFSCERLYWKKGTLHIEKGKIDPGALWNFSFEKMVWRPSFEIFHRSIGGDLSLENIHIVCRDQDPFRECPLLQNSSSFFRWKGRTKIESGTVEISSPNQESRSWAIGSILYDARHTPHLGELTLENQEGVLLAKVHLVRCLKKQVELGIEFKEKGIIGVWSLIRQFFPDNKLHSFLAWELIDGSFDGTVEIVWDKYLQDLKGTFSGNSLVFRNDALSLEGKMGSIETSILMNRRPQATASWEIDFHLAEGEMYSEYPALGIFRELGPLYLRDAQFSIKDGQITYSSILAKLCGMEGTVFLNDNDKTAPITLTFSGSSENIVPYLAKEYQDSFALAFNQDIWNLEAYVTPNLPGLDIYTNNLKNENFGCAKTPGLIDREQPHISNIGLLSIDQSREFSRQPKSNSSGCLCINGKFSIEGPGGKYEVAFGSATKNAPNQTLLGSSDEFSDSDEWKCYGNRALAHPYWFKGVGLPLNKFLRPFLLAQTNCFLSGFGNFEGSFDQGSLMVRYSGLQFGIENPSFSLQAETVEKKISPGLIGIHFVDFKEKKQKGVLPLTRLCYTQKSVGVHFFAEEAVVEFEGSNIFMKNLQCHYKEIDFMGNVTLSIPNFNSVDLVLSCDHVKGKYDQAALLCSKFLPSKFWKVPLTGTIEGKKDSLFFHFISQPKFTLVDARIQAEWQGELGTTLLGLNCARVPFEYDLKKSHLLISPFEGLLTFPTLSNKVYQFEVEECALTHFPNPEMLVSIQVNEGGSSVFSGSARMEKFLGGRLLSVEGDQLNLKGVLQGDRFAIQTFQWQSLQGEVYGTIGEKGYQLDRLKLRYKELLSLFFEGEIDVESLHLNGTLSQVLIDLNHLSDVSVFSKFFPASMDSGKLKGKLSCEGSIHWDIPAKDCSLEAIASVDELEWGGYYFGEGKNLQCHYSTTKGLSIEGFEGRISSDGAPFRFSLGEFRFALTDESLDLKNCTFTISLEKLRAIAEDLSNRFPKNFPSQVLTAMDCIDHKVPLEGCFSIHLSARDKGLLLKLNEGSYSVCNRKFFIKDFTANFSNEKTEISTVCLWKDQPLTIYLRTPGWAFHDGEMSIKESGDYRPPLKISWSKDKEHFCFESIQGTVLGMEFHLQKKEESMNGHVLNGVINCNLREAKHLFPLTFESWIDKLSLGAGYTIAGDFQLSIFPLNLDGFRGTLNGKEFEVGNFHVESLSSEIIYDKEHLSLRNFQVADNAGEMNIALLELFRHQDQWEVQIPRLSLRNARPSLLRKEMKGEKKKHKSYLKTFIIPRLEIENLAGVIGKASSFSGKGEMHFNHVQTNNFLSNLLYIPTEITGRIGLDFSLLVPVRGTVRYEIHDGKIHLLKLENSYSEGKRSRFYLVDDTAAYIDFDGKLSLQLGMKQYNLLMKIAELFTISVNGTIFKPTYSLGSPNSEG